MANTSTSPYEALLEEHPGLTSKSPDNQCLNDLFAEDPRGQDAGPILDATVSFEYRTHRTTEGNLFLYRVCGKTACNRECGIVIDHEGTVLDAAPFVAPCTGKD